VSYCLDLLLGAERLACCLSHDAIAFQPKDSAMKHPIPMGRVFADMEAHEQPESLNEEYEFTQIRFGEPDHSQRMRFPNAVEANSYANALQAQGCVVIYRPASESR
jgi:hypothetical protein